MNTLSTFKEFAQVKISAILQNQSARWVTRTFGITKWHMTHQYIYFKKFLNLGWIGIEICFNFLYAVVLRYIAKFSKSLFGKYFMNIWSGKIFFWSEIGSSSRYCHKVKLRISSPINHSLFFWWCRKSSTQWLFFSFSISLFCRTRLTHFWPLFL